MDKIDITLQESRVRNMLKTEYIGKDFHFFEETTSTFDAADHIAIKNGSVFCARKQTNGRGRLGRSWESQNGGIYFSIILMPDARFSEVQIMTALCAVGIRRALSKFLPCSIKWPNDIVSKDGKKICGILTKLKFIDDGKAIVNVGIGINANTKKFDDELKYASSVALITGKDVDENLVLCGALEEVERCISFGNISETIEEYKKECVTLGKRVRVLYATSGESVTGLCEDIKDDGSLIVKTDEGEIINVRSGEVSVRGIYGENYV
ncbi:MAG: biotin--[acetyl-CoA-carboxylase] ligase [Clostridia bacterium]|nr:biotin--[acetyl-CoA-carboxylase] ligase [Clostridia bacterium]